MTVPRVVYLSAPPLGEQMLEWLRTQDCEIVHATTDDAVVLFVDPDFQYDLGLNFLGSRRIPASQVHRPRLGWANFHPAPLPEFGGRNVAYHAIVQGAKGDGASVHYMSEHFDAGPLIDVRRFPITEAHTAGDLMTTAKGLLVKMFMDWVPKLLQGRVSAKAQAGVRCFTKGPIPDLIHLDANGQRQVRALTCHPKHHARLEIGGRKYKIVPGD